MAADCVTGTNDFCQDIEKESLSRRREAEERLTSHESVTCANNQLTVLSHTWSFKSKNTNEKRTVCLSNLDRRRWLSKHILVLQIFLALVITSLPAASADETCTMKIVVHVIRYNNCLPKRVLATSCLGSCRSYAAIDPENPTNILSSCKCCQPVGLRETRVPLRCPNSDGTSGYSRVPVTLNLPTSCMCRPCDFLPQIEPAEFMS